MNLLEVFKGMPEYVVIKMRDDFPNYTPGQDIDILCKDINEIRHCLIDYFLDDGYFHFELGGTYTYIENQRTPHHLHFDCMELDKIDLRFDVYSEFINPIFTTDALYTYTIRKGVRTPLEIYDNVIKAYEYSANGKEKYADYAKYKCLLEVYKDYDDPRPTISTR